VFSKRLVAGQIQPKRSTNRCCSIRSDLVCAVTKLATNEVDSIDADKIASKGLDESEVADAD